VARRWIDCWIFLTYAPHFPVGLDIEADTLATSQAHVNRALYSDPDILKKFPHFPILLKS
jgi:hypothetical protein